MSSLPAVRDASVIRSLNTGRMNEIDPEAFRRKQPFPWISIHQFVRDELFRELCETLPHPNSMERQSGRKGGVGDLYALQYRPSLALAAPWLKFIAELRSPPYTDFLHRMLGLSHRQQIELTMHWHFAPSGFSLEPHVDAERKLASHIFYFNTESDWDPRWGGQTVILNDHGGYSIHDRPRFEDLDECARPEVLGSRSLLFQRTPRSWHGVRPLTSPAGKYRKVFIVVVNRVNLQVEWRHLRGKDADGYPRTRTILSLGDFPT